MFGHGKTEFQEAKNGLQSLAAKRPIRQRKARWLASSRSCRKLVLEPVCVGEFGLPAKWPTQIPSLQASIWRDPLKILNPQKGVLFTCRESLPETRITGSPKEASYRFVGLDLKLSELRVSNS